MRVLSQLALGAALSLLLPLPARAESVDLEVDRDAELSLELNSGTLLVQTWDEDRILLEAWADEPLDLDLRQRGSRVSGRVEGIRGHPVSADVEVHMPRWMAVDMSARDMPSEFTGIEAPIEVRLLAGDLLIEGGRERIRVRSVQGAVNIRNASGDIDIHSTNEDIRLRDVEGSIIAESVHGDIKIEAAAVTDAELVTTSGDVFYDGLIDRNGDYLFETHGGDVRIAIPPDTSALVLIETFDGEVFAHGATLEGALKELRRGREFQAELGDAHARIRIRNFNGDVELYDLKRGRGKSN
jgi:hypothetical protein